MLVEEGRGEGKGKEGRGGETMEEGEGRGGEGRQWRRGKGGEGRQEQQAVR